MSETKCPCGTQRCPGQEMCFAQEPFDFKGVIKRYEQSKDAKTFPKIVELIKAERARQDEKWGIQNHNGYIWNTILGEEVGEVAMEVLEIETGGDGTIEHLKEELIQVAAVAVSWYQCLERNKDIP